MWKWRDLSLAWKNSNRQNVCCSQTSEHLCYPLPTEELIKEANSIIYGFIWNGKDKIKGHALISDLNKGELKMLDIESMIKAKRVVCMKKFLEDYPSSWETIFDKILSPIGRRFILYCNFDTAKLRVPLPAYYKECLDAWLESNNITPSSSHEVVNEIIKTCSFVSKRCLCIEVT